MWNGTGVLSTRFDVAGSWRPLELSYDCREDVNNDGQINVLDI